MKEFCKKEIEFQVIKLNNTVDKMVEVMKAHHQEVDVVDMSGVKDEIRAERMRVVEESAGTIDAEELAKRRTEAACAPSHLEVEREMETRFIERTTMGLSKAVKSKRMKR